MPKKIVIICIVSLCMIGLFFAPSARAQQSGLDLTMSPTILDITALPGDVVKQKFRIRNNTSDKIDLQLSVDKLENRTENGQVVPAKPLPGDTTINWISFENKEVSASAKEWIDIPVTITIPKDAAFGYYFAIRIGQAHGATQSKSGASLLGEVVLPVLLTVKTPNPTATLQLLSFTTPSLVEYLPTTFAITVKNVGNVHLRPIGNVFIRIGNSDKDTALLEINPSNGAVLPGGTRTFTTSWNDGFLVQEPVIEDGTPKLDSKGNPVTHLKINWDKLTHFRIGNYTATALVVYDNGKRDVPLQVTTTFWVLPYRLLGAFFGTLLIASILGKYILKWYIQREIKKYNNK